MDSTKDRHLAEHIIAMHSGKAKEGKAAGDGTARAAFAARRRAQRDEQDELDTDTPLLDALERRVERAKRKELLPPTLVRKYIA